MVIVPISAALRLSRSFEQRPKDASSFAHAHRRESMKSKDWRPTAFVETQPGVVSEEEADAGRADQRRSVDAFLRHLMTLGTAATVLTAVLAEKAFAQPLQRMAVGVAVLAFVISVIVAGATSLSLLASQPAVGALRAAAGHRRIQVASAALGLVGFLAGLGSLAWFFWVNWFRA
jgi:hypothetical protein